MDRASIEFITRELTARQQEAHNNNYNSLADKDIEIFYSIDGKIQNYLENEQISDSMIGSRTAVDPFNENTSDGTLFTGELTAWLSRISSRVIGLAQTLGEYSISGYSNTETMQKGVLGDSIGEAVAQSSYRQLDGMFLGTLPWDKENGQFRFPCTPYLVDGADESAKYYFYMDRDFAEVDCLGVRVVWIDDDSCSVQRDVFSFVGEGLENIQRGTLYAACFEDSSGQMKIKVRKAREGDFMEVNV